MLNIPTDLLRTLVAVVDMRSFTKAAQFMGVTQPAVSAQIKRLQYLLGYEVLDKSAPGVSLTPRGEIVVNNARRLLSVNDEILHLTTGHMPERWPDVSYNVNCAPVEEMLRDLQHGVLDIVLATFTERPTIEARHIWTQELVWVRSDAVKPDPNGPVPLVSYGGDSTCQRAAVATLHCAGLDCNFVFTSQSNASLLAAVAAGFGVMAVPRGRAVRNNLVIWEDSPLPKLAELYCALVVREGGDRTAIDELADYLEDQIRVEPNSPGFVGAPPVAGADRA